MRIFPYLNGKECFHIPILPFYWVCLWVIRWGEGLRDSQTVEGFLEYSADKLGAVVADDASGHAIAQKYFVDEGPSRPTWLRSRQ